MILKKTLLKEYSTSLMKIKLSYKIFGVLLITTVVLIALTMASLRFLLHRSFEEYINKVEMESLTDLKDNLTEEYLTYGSWEHLRSNKELWNQIIAKSLDQNVFKEKPSDFSAIKEDISLERANAIKKRDRILKIGSRLFLLDTLHQKVSGFPGKAENQRLIQIVVSGNTVGWLGLRDRPPRKNHPEVVFLTQQSKYLFGLGSAIIIITAIISFLLSRHVLGPIKQLTDGTGALASRKFETRLDVQTNDELGQLASDFNSMAETLEKYEKMRHQWIADISHELRTPLSVLRGEIEAIQDGVRPANNKTLESLHTEILHLAKLVDDLYELSQADSGTLNMHKTSINPIDILQGTVDLFDSRFVEKKMSINLNNFCLRQKTTMNGDVDRFRQLFSNILENTLRYTDSPGTLIIASKVENDYLTITFEDSGPGVPEEALSKLFERLYRIDASRNREKGGSGLGLSICKTIVDAHGGKISAAHSPAGGLKIEIVFPVSITVTSSIHNDEKQKHFNS